MPSQEDAVAFMDSQLSSFKPLDVCELVVGLARLGYEARGDSAALDRAILHALDQQQGGGSWNQPGAMDHYSFSSLVWAVSALGEAVGRETRERLMDQATRLLQLDLDSFLEHPVAFAR